MKYGCCFWENETPGDEFHGVRMNAWDQHVNAAIRKQEMATDIPAKLQEMT